MRNTRDELNEFDQVAYGKTSKVFLPKLTNLASIILDTSNINADQMEQVLLRLDSDIAIDMPMTKLLAIEKYNNLQVEGDNRFYKIPFANLAANTIEGQESTHLQLLDENATLQIKLAPATSAQKSSGSVPELSAHANFGQAIRNKDGMTVRPTILIREEETISINKAGKNTYDGFEARSALGLNLLRTAHFFGGNVERVKVYVKSAQSGEWILRHNADLELNNRYLKEADKKPITDCYTFDPVALGWVNADQLMPELGIKFEIFTTDSENVDVVWEKFRFNGVG